MEIYAFDLMPWPHLKERSEYPDPNSLYDPAIGHHLYQEHLQQLCSFEEYGFDAICINEHHSSPYGSMPSPNIIAAILSQLTSTIKIAICGNLPALHAHPVRLAEEIAMLDVLSGGRIISGFVRGVAREYLAYSVNLDDAREMMEESWDLIIKAWTEREPFAWHGKFYHYDRVCIWPRPLQQPHPPIIMPAESPGSQEIAARRRAPSGTAYRSIEQSKKILDNYRALCRKHGWEPQASDVTVLRNIYVADSNAKAREEAKEHADYFWQKLLSWHRGVMRIQGQDPDAEGSPTSALDAASPQYDRPFWQVDYDYSNETGQSICGDPDFVIEQILRQHKELDFGVLMAMFQFGSMPHDMATKNIEMFSKHVLPELRKHAPQLAAGG